MPADTAPQGDPHSALIDAWRERLLVRYAEPHRHYHTRRHIDEMLSLWPGVRGLATHPGEVEVAIWFHDAIYAPSRHDNEERSAKLAEEATREAGLDGAAIARIRDLVLVTRHDAAPRTTDESILVDLDLAILGASEPRFDEYERQVRAEYAAVPGILFRHTRRGILKRFLERPRIYATDALFASHESRARENLQRSIVALGG